MKILLIAGHGAGDPGAPGSGYKEADLTREAADLLGTELSRYASVVVFDTSKNAYQYLKNGGYINFKPFDYVLEIHFNAAVNDTKGNGKTTGTEIYITESEKGYSVEQNIVKGITNIGFKNRGVKRKNFDVISAAKRQGVSAALLEVCFIDDIDDMKLYQSNKREIAKAITKGIVDGFGLKKGVENMKFKDVSIEHWAYKAIEEAAEKGYMQGYPDGTFRPEEPVTRAEMAAVLSRIKKEG